MLKLSNNCFERMRSASTSSGSRKMGSLRYLKIPCI